MLQRKIIGMSVVLSYIFVDLGTFYEPKKRSTGCPRGRRQGCLFQATYYNYFYIYVFKIIVAVIVLGVDGPLADHIPHCC